MVSIDDGYEASQAINPSLSGLSKRFQYRRLFPQIREATIMVPLLLKSYFPTRLTFLTALSILPKKIPRRPPDFRHEMTSEDHQRQIASLLKDIGSSEAEKEKIYNDETVRAKLLQSAKRLVSALEKPGDAVINNAFLVFSFLTLKRLGSAC